MGAPSRYGGVWPELLDCVAQGPPTPCQGMDLRIGMPTAVLGPAGTCETPSQAVSGMAFEVLRNFWASKIADTAGDSRKIAIPNETLFRHSRLILARTWITTRGASCYSSAFILGPGYDLKLPRVHS